MPYWSWNVIHTILCVGCKHWVHKKCFGLETIAKDPTYQCPRSARCRDDPGMHPIDGCLFNAVQVGGSELENVDHFCCLGDKLSAGGGSMAAATSRCRSAWGKFHEHVLVHCHLSLRVACSAQMCVAPCCMQLRPGPYPLLLATSYVEMIMPWSGGYAESGLLRSLIWSSCIRSSVLKTTPYSCADIDCDCLGMLSAPPAKSVGSDRCR